MELKNCTFCGKVFASSGASVCPECMKAEEDDYSKVREFLDINPGANIEDIHQGTRVEKTKILKFIHEGRLTSRTVKDLALNCRICGDSIEEGHICSACARELNSDSRSEFLGDLSSEGSAKDPAEGRRQDTPEAEPSRQVRMYSRDVVTKKRRR